MWDHSIGRAVAAKFSCDLEHGVRGLCTELDIMLAAPPGVAPPVLRLQHNMGPDKTYLTAPDGQQWLSPPFYLTLWGLTVPRRAPTLMRACACSDRSTRVLCAAAVRHGAPTPCCGAAAARAQKWQLLRRQQGCCLVL